MNKVDCFDGKYAFLSNFSPSPIVFDCVTYPTVEHFFQALKSLNRDERRSIAAAASPGKAKRMGRQVKLREDWEDIKLDVMREGLRLKFKDPKLKAKLLATGDAYLEEGNTWHDTYWGVCNGIGQNHLGLLLMEIREELQNQDAN